MLAIIRHAAQSVPIGDLVLILAVLILISLKSSRLQWFAGLVESLNQVEINVWAVAILGSGVYLMVHGQTAAGSGLTSGGFALLSRGLKPNGNGSAPAAPAAPPQAPVPPPPSTRDLTL